MPPRDMAELIDRARQLEDRSLAWIAARLDVAMPPDLRRHKGWVGTLMEAALGATGGSAAVRDFPELAVELKTIPVDGDGQPLESTYVCTAPLGQELLVPWEESWLWAKLSRVLWIPILGSGPLGQRTVGRALLWTPSPGQEATLRADWEELSDLLALGHFDQLDATWGEALQVRPKGRSSRDRTWALDADGQWVLASPRGFYLRRTFTRKIISG